MSNGNNKKRVWLCDLSHTYQTIAMNKIPLSVGMIASYCRQQIGNLFTFEIFKFLDEIEKEIEDGKTPEIVGLANYVWNQNLNLEIAKRIKLTSPQSIIVLGGPNFPLDKKMQYEFFKKNSWVDFYIVYEGEEAFRNLLACLHKNNFDIRKVKKEIPSQTVFIDDNEIKQGKILPRLKISELLSPYLEGLFDKYIKDYVPMIQKTRGCPFSCCYCFDGTEVGNKIFHRDLSQLKEELLYIVKQCNQSYELYITDANFGMYAHDIEFCKIINELQKKYSWPWLISLNTGKKNVERIYQAAKLTLGAITVTASIQSTDPVVLKNIKRRNLPLEKLLWLTKSIKMLAPDSWSYSEIILCLPGDTIKAHLKSIKDVMDGGIDSITSFQLMILPGTPLDTEECRKKEKIQTKFRVLPRCFGKYQWSGDEFTTAEIEEICIANNTMSFNDYLECRKFNLTVAIYYNDSVLCDLYRVLSELKISVFELIYNLHRKAVTIMRDIYDEFVSETKRELWDSKEEIIRFINQQGGIEKYKKGIYGANLLFKYKILAYKNHITEIIQSAYEAAKNIVKKSTKANKLDFNILHFLDDLQELHKDIIEDFLKVNKSYTVSFSHNVVDFRNNVLTVKEIKEENRKYIIEHTSEQKKIIQDNLRLHGDTIVGLTKFLSQIPSKKILRNKFHVLNNIED